MIWEQKSYTVFYRGKQLAKRKNTIQIKIKNVKIGGMAPISVQSMTNTFTQDVPATVAQIKRLEKAGCEIVRVAVPDQEAAAAIPAIKKEIAIPLIADIHFDHRLAIASAEAGADGLRINPGNIGGGKKLKAVIDSAKEFNIPIRIGVNSGSVEKDLLKKYQGASAEAMVGVLYMVQQHMVQLLMLMPHPLLLIDNW